MTELTAQQRAEMRAAAEAALADKTPDSFDGPYGMRVSGTVKDHRAHVAASCPVNVIALLDLCDRLEKERDASREHASALAAALEEASGGLERIHASLMSNGPKQASGEMTAYFCGRAASVLDAHRAKEGGGG